MLGFTVIAKDKSSAKHEIKIYFAQPHIHTHTRARARANNFLADVIISARRVGDNFYSDLSVWPHLTTNRAIVDRFAWKKEKKKKTARATLRFCCSGQQNRPWGWPRPLFVVSVNNVRSLQDWGRNTVT